MSRKDSNEIEARTVMQFLLLKFTLEQVCGRQFRTHETVWVKLNVCL
jgi:hypothetical protein